MMRKNHRESQLSIYAAEWQSVKGPKKSGRPKKDVKKNGGHVGTIKTRDEAGGKFGIGGRTVSRAANVLEKVCKQLQQANQQNRSPQSTPNDS